MAFTQDKLNALEDAIAEGTLEVKYRDRTITYRSLNEMLKIRDLIRKNLGIISKGSVRLKASFDKGLTDGTGRDQ